MKNRIAAKCLMFATGLMVMFGLMVTRTVAAIKLNMDFTGHLKRAADANSLELAERELDVAVKWMGRNYLDTPSGRNLGRIDDHTSVLWPTPDEQLSFFYENITSSLAEIRAVIAKGDEATPLEKSNVLMKLRETLLDHTGEDGTHVTRPAGLDIYPYNAQWGFGMLVGLFILAFGVGSITLEMKELDS